MFDIYFHNIIPSFLKTLQAAWMIFLNGKRKHYFWNKSKENKKRVHPLGEYHVGYTDESGPSDRSTEELPQTTSIAGLVHWFSEPIRKLVKT